MSHKLSEGSLEVIMNGGHYDRPVMQVLGSKKIQGSGANERFRLLVSDGKHSHSFAMLATQLNDKLISGELSDYSVVQIDRFVTSLLKNTGKGEKRVMIILDITILSPGSEVGKKLGNPETWTEESAAAAQASTSAAPRPAPAAPSPQLKPQPTQAPNLDSSLLSAQMTHPISSLSPYQNKKSRTTATNAQVNALIDFVSEHSEMVSGIAHSVLGRSADNILWSQLTEMLNNLGGAKKTVTQWKRVWSHRRHVAIKRISYLQSTHNMNYENHLSDNDKKIKAIIGSSITDPVAEVSDQDASLENVDENENQEKDDQNEAQENDELDWPDWDQHMLEGASNASIDAFSDVIPESPDYDANSVPQLRTLSQTEPASGPEMEPFWRQSINIEKEKKKVLEGILGELKELNKLIKWVVKARVMNKSDIKTWNNARGEGKLFSMDLCDESGEIRATAFKNECDKFYDMIQIDKVYYISRCTLKTANKQYTSIKNDYEMTFTPNTVVAECMEDSSTVPSVKYDFLPINDIASKTPDTLLDIVGVCKSAADLQELTAKSSGKLLKKREVTLVDNSGGAVGLTLWGKEAENFDGSTNPILAIKGARLTEFNGSKSLSCLASTMIRQNPDLPEAHKLRGWYDNGGADMEIVNISARAGGYSGGSSEWISFADAEARQLGAGEKGDYYSLLGVLTFTFADNAVYKACPQEQCNKKLVDQENGLYRCEKCNREYPNYKYRLLLAANVSDPTGDQRITAFNEAAEAMLGKNVADIGQMFEYDKTAYTQMFEEVKFKTFVFKFRTKMETYNDEARLKTTVVSVQPVDFKDANKRLLASIKTLTGIEV